MSDRKVTGSASEPSAKATPSSADSAAHTSSDQEHHHVRFSKDMNPATVSVPTGDRPGTPTLTLDTTSAQKAPIDVAGSAVGLSHRKTLSPTKTSPKSPASPTSPRTRDRGYSLRRTLFARGINTHSEQSPIELVESAPAEAEENDRRLEEGRGKTSRPSVSFARVNPEDGRKWDSADSGTGLSSTNRSRGTLGTLSLPNYDIWARTRSARHPLLRKTYRFYKDKIYKPIFLKKEFPPSKDGRHIDFDASRKTVIIDERTGREHIGNSIRSSRYTVWDFVPRQLFFQFSKLANAYFLLVSVLQMVPGLSPVGSYTTIAPLLVFIAISMGKEGWDDVRRYKLDKIENNTETLGFQATQPALKEEDLVSITSGGKLRAFRPKPRSEKNASSVLDGSLTWVALKWKDVKVGDVLKLQRNDPVPADMVLLYADGTNGIAYIDTMALDGETNLKTKQAPHSLSKLCQTVDGIAACKAHIVVEDPNLDLYNFDGRLTVAGETIPLTTNEIVFRGSTLRNTSTAIGMVINTGEECKIRMNANKSPRIKTPAMQAISNKIVVMLVIFVILLSLFCTIAYQIWTRITESDSWYLDGAHVKFSWILVGFIILFNTLIPLSLYVSLEIIKVGLLLLMKDVDMYDPVSKTPMICNTTTILENLGQVDYIFSDKTGTLTENIMRFRKVSIAGYAFLHDFDLQKEAAEKLHKSQQDCDGIEKGKGKGVAKSMTARRKKQQPVLERNDSDLTTNPDLLRRSSTASLWKSSARPLAAQPELRTEELIQFMSHKPHSVFTKKAKFFLLSLALCHTCLPEVQENGEIEFQAASPDELALVKAAQECGYLVSIY